MPRICRIPIVSLLFGVATFVLLTPEPIHACEFDAQPRPQSALDDANAVFSGVVTSIEPVDDDPGEQHIAATIDVDRAWKGIDSSPVIVETHQDEATCGFPFEEGESYIVYAYSEGTPLTTALYHRTALLERAEEDLDALGDGIEVEAAAEETDDEDEFNTGLLILGAVVVSIIAATIMLLRQSKPGLPENLDDTDDEGTSDDRKASSR